MLVLASAFAIGAGFAAGCGSSTAGGSAPGLPVPTAQEIITKAQAAGQKATSARVAFKATIDVKQAPGATASSDLGPLANGPATISGTIAVATSPLTMDMSARLATVNDGATMSFGMRVVDGKGWVSVLGQWYKMPADFEQSLKDAQARQSSAQPTLDLLRAAGVDPAKWARDLTLVGTEKVDGVEAYHISATLDAKQFVSDLIKLMASPDIGKIVGSAQAQQLAQNMPTAADLQEVEKVFKGVSGDAWYATGTYDVVKLTAKAELVAPSDQEIDTSGVQSVTVDLEMTQSKIDEPVKVQAPANALPWEQGPFTNSSTSSSSSGVDQLTGRDAVVAEGIHSIQVGIQSWAVDHNDAYPPHSLVTKSGLGIYVDNWPTNPYTAAPMALGTDAGDYSYTTSSGSFRLSGYGADGKAVITVP
jgi:hypothetical protein